MWFNLNEWKGCEWGEEDVRFYFLLANRRIMLCPAGIPSCARYSQFRHREFPVVPIKGHGINNHRGEDYAILCF